MTTTFPFVLANPDDHHVTLMVTDQAIRDGDRHYRLLHHSESDGRFVLTRLTPVEYSLRVFLYFDSSLGIWTVKENCERDKCVGRINMINDRQWQAIFNDPEINKMLSVTNQTQRFEYQNLEVAEIEAGVAFFQYHTKQTT